MALDLSQYQNWDALMNSVNTQGQWLPYSYRGPAQDGWQGNYSSQTESTSPTDMYLPGLGRIMPSYSGQGGNGPHGTNPAGISLADLGNSSLGGVSVPDQGMGVNHVLSRNPDGSIKQRDVSIAGDDFISKMIDIAPYIAGSAVLGMGAGMLGTPGAASGASGLGDVAAGAGGGTAAAAPSDIASWIGTTGAGGSTAGAGMDFTDLLGKGMDFATSKGGSALLGGLLGGIGSKGPDSTTSTSSTQLDPRMAAYLYGQGGLIPQIMGNMNKPQSAGLAGFGGGANNYLGGSGMNDFASSMGAAQHLQNSGITAPTMEAATIGNIPTIESAKVTQLPQNSINLAPAYSDFIYGAPGANPYLTGSIQKGIDQSNNAFSNMQTDATRNMMENILPNIRGGAIVNGAMGGSRQGIAEGKALNDFSTQMGRAMSQFGQNNTDAAVSAQAGAYDTDRSRALAAAQGLGSQQYGVAQQDAQAQQAANMANGQIAAQKATQEAQNRMTSDQTNISALLGTNTLNSDNQRAGTGLTSGLLGQAYGYGTNQDQYGGQKVGQAAGLLAPFTGLGATSTQTTPLYNNTAGGILGGALGGSALYNAFNQPQTNTGGYTDEMARLKRQANGGL